MSSNLIVSLLVLCAFLFMYFFYSQRLYRTRYLYLFLLLVLFSVIATFGFSFITYKKHEVKTPFLLLAPCYYMVLMIGIKTFYKKINDFLTRKKLVNARFAGKDFTFTFLAATKLTWDTKKAEPPSWLDTLLCMILLGIPLLGGVVSGGAID